MGTSRQEIGEWLKRGRKKGATHVIVACDTFDYSDYPIFVMPGQDVREVEKETRNESMTRVMEVYSLSLGDERQLNERRSFNY